jgi:hypothetical protein
LISQGPIADQAVLVSGEDPHLGDRPGHHHEVAQRGLLLAPDPGAHLGVDEVALVSLAATLATDGDLGRGQRRHQLAASQQLADQDGAVAAIGLDHPEGLAAPAGEPDDPRDELVDRRCVVVDSLPEHLHVLGRAGDDAVAVSARVDADDQTRAHPTTSVHGRRAPGSSRDRDCHLTHMSDRAQMSIR